MEYIFLNWNGTEKKLGIFILIYIYNLYVPDIIT